MFGLKSYTAIVERDRDTGYYVGHIPEFPGAHSQGESLNELRENLREAIEMLLEDNGHWEPGGPGPDEGMTGC